MKELIVRVAIKPNIVLDDLKKFGFNWIHADPEKGVHWTNTNGITIYSSDRIIHYDKLTQAVLDTILALCCAGLAIIVKPA